MKGGGREPWLRLSGARRLPAIRQATVSECGLACVAMIVAYHGRGEDLVSLRRRFPVSANGATLDTLIDVFEALELAPRALRCELAEVRRLRTPCILHWGLNHFVVLRKAARDSLVIHDPAQGRLRVPAGEADRMFTGVVLEVEAPPALGRKEPVRRLRLGDLLDFNRDFAASLAAAMLFAALSEVLLLAAPFYLQIVIDQVLLRGDHVLLNALALGFALLAVFQVLAGVMRQLTTQFLSQTTVFSLSTRVLRHLLHLPVSYFRSRRLGDVQQRMQALGKIQAFVTEGAPALVLDAFFLVLVCALMLAYEARLALYVAAAAVLYASWRGLIFGMTFEQANKLVRAEAAAQTHLLESLRAAQSIKLLAGEAGRTRSWQERFARRVNAQIRLGNLHAADSALRQTVFQGLHLAVVYLLARRVMEGSLSIGMMSAFVAYMGMFVTRVSGVIDRWFEYRLLRVPLERLADIVFSEGEAVGRAGSAAPRLAGDVALREVAFCYAGERREVIRDCSLRIGSGEFVAIHGPSGCGKSTLLRIIAGIEAPTHGDICFGDRPAANWPAAAVRAQLGTVFPDDTLVAGSIGANIALFDPHPDRDRMRRAARLAVVDAVIERLPMAYESRVGDLGSALSTGQVQRILFARALYRRPRLLLLDEFTSGLDEDTERLVLATLARLRATRIVVSHSPIVLRAADRVVAFDSLQASPGTRADRLSAGSGPGAASGG
jgi:ATP-binding cassette subfamily B protein RaxB